MVHEYAPVIDIGAENIYVSYDGTEVITFDTYTEDYYRCAAYLQEKEVEDVAMEATGIYWIAFYVIAETCGLKVCLVNPKETKQVKGRKTDVKDCWWIQKLFVAGILWKRFIPPEKYMELRQLVRDVCM